MDINSKYKEIVRCIPNSECEFQYIEVEGGMCLPEDSKNMNRLLFVLKGEVKVFCGNTQEYVVGEKELCLIPREYKWYGETFCKCVILIMRFKKVKNIWTKKQIEKLLSAYPNLNVNVFPVLSIKPLLQVFLDLLAVYIKEKNIEKSLFTLKDEELLSLLYVIYASRDLSPLFFPVLQSDADFKSFVLADYLKTESASGLVDKQNQLL